jgi:hypothetical protein
MKNSEEHEFDQLNSEEHEFDPNFDQLNSEEHEFDPNFDQLNMQILIQIPNQEPHIDCKCKLI